VWYLAEYENGKVKMNQAPKPEARGGVFKGQRRFATDEENIKEIRGNRDGSGKNQAENGYVKREKRSGKRPEISDLLYITASS